MVRKLAVAVIRERLYLEYLRTISIGLPLLSLVCSPDTTLPIVEVSEIVLNIRRIAPACNHSRWWKGFIRREDGPVFSCVKAQNERAMAVARPVLSSLFRLV